MKMNLTSKLIATAACLLFYTSPMMAQDETKTITLAYSKGGRVLINDENVRVKILPKEEKITFTVFPDNGVNITGIFVNGVSRPILYPELSQSYGFTGWTTDLDFAVTFGDIPHCQLIASCNEGGKVLINGQNFRTDMIEEGESATFSIIPDKGYAIKEVIFNDVSVIGQLSDWPMPNAPATYISSPVTERSRLEVVFGEIFYQVVASCNEGGKIFINDRYIPDDAIKENEKVIFTIVPDQKYSISEITFNDASVIEQLSALPVPGFPGVYIYTYTFPALTEDSRLEVVFEEKVRHKVITSCNEKGKVLINGKEILEYMIKESETVTFTIVPNEGDFVSEVTFNGTSVIDQLLDWTTPDMPATYISPPITEQSILEVVFTSIISINAATLPIKVYATSGVLVVEGATAGEPISIYSQTGVYIKTEQANNSRTRIPLPAGMYIVKVGKQTVKIVL